MSVRSVYSSNALVATAIAALLCQRASAQCVMTISDDALVVAGLPASAAGALCLSDRRYWRCRAVKADRDGVVARRFKRSVEGLIWFESIQPRGSVTREAQVCAAARPIKPAGFPFALPAWLFPLLTGLAVAFVPQHLAERQRSKEARSNWVSEYRERLLRFVHGDKVDPLPLPLPFGSAADRSFLEGVAELARNRIASLGLAEAASLEARAAAVELILRSLSSSSIPAS